MRRRDFLRLTAAAAAGSLATTRMTAQSLSIDQHPRRGRTARQQVLVIGAGISGLAAAKRLVTEFGLSGAHQVIVLEARNRIGGRIHTDTSLGAPVEMGANWIHGINNNPITALADEFGASRAATNYNSMDAFDTDGSPVSTSAVNQAYSQLFSIFNQASSYASGLAQDQSLEQTLLDINAGGGLSPTLRRLVGWLLNLELEGSYTQYASDLSSFHYDGGASFSGPDNLFPGGYSQIPAGVAQGLDIRLDHVVETVQQIGHRVFVHTNRGSFSADACVVTLPLGVLKAEHVHFQPGLPYPLRSAIQRMGFGKVAKVILEFPNSFWNNNRHLLAYVSSQPEFHTWWLNVGRHSSAPILNTWTFQDHAVDLENMNLTDASDRVMQDLRTIYGEGIPAPVNAVKTAWSTDPFTMGSYSYPATGSGPSDHDQFLPPVRNTIHFAGEHTSSLYHSTVHGAYLSGLDAAGRVMGDPSFTANQPAAFPLGRLLRKTRRRAQRAVPR